MTFEKSKNYFGICRHSIVHSILFIFNTYIDYALIKYTNVSIIDET